MRADNGIERLVADGICDDIVQRVKTGKEAEVFIVRKGDQYLAAKLYKEREQRSFRNNAVYREGRQVRSSRDRRAIDKGTRWGQERAEADWIATEHDALFELQDSGVRVPKPELLYENVLLMELILDSEGQPAPRLLDVALTEEQALEFHRDIVGQIIAMLIRDVIHGDLSPYNILVAWNGPTIIDLPQVIRAAHNQQSEMLLVRDVRNVTEHLARFAPSLKRRVNDGYAIWRQYTRRELTTDYFPEEGAWERSGGSRKRTFQPAGGRSSNRPAGDDRNHRTERPARSSSPRPQEHHGDRNASDRRDRSSGRGPSDRSGSGSRSGPPGRTDSAGGGEQRAGPNPRREWRGNRSSGHPGDRASASPGSTRPPRVFDRPPRSGADRSSHGESRSGKPAQQSGERPKGNDPFGSGKPASSARPPRRGNHRQRSSRGRDDRPTS